MSNFRAISAIVGLLGLGMIRPASAQRTPRPGAQDRFWDAAISGDTAVLNAALDSGAVIDPLDVRESENGRRALNWAAINGNVAVIRILLARGAPIEEKNLTFNTALHHAAEAGSLSAARVLLIAGADPKAINLSGSSPRDVAIRNGHLEVAMMLEQAERGERPLGP
jgi:ankyrin repeat protein